MGDTVIKCICGSEVTMPDGYTDSATCPDCGSFFDYDEGFDMRITQEQSDCLMRHQSEWLKKS
jgi:hypothetical protein